MEGTFEHFAVYNVFSRPYVFIHNFIYFIDFLYCEVLS